MGLAALPEGARAQDPLNYLAQLLARLDEYLMRSDDGVRWEITAQVATAAAGD